MLKRDATRNDGSQLGRWGATVKTTGKLAGPKICTVVILVRCAAYPA